MSTAAGNVLIEGAPLAHLWFLSVRAERNTVFFRKGNKLMCTQQLLQIILQIHRRGEIGVVMETGALVGAQRQDNGLRQAAEGQVRP